jgi:hypothetical protein
MPVKASPKNEMTARCLDELIIDTAQIVLEHAKRHQRFRIDGGDPRETLINLRASQDILTALVIARSKIEVV